MLYHNQLVNRNELIRRKKEKLSLKGYRIVAAVDVGVSSIAFFVMAYKDGKEIPEVIMYKLDIINDIVNNYDGNKKDDNVERREQRGSRRVKYSAKKRKKSVVKFLESLKAFPLNKVDIDEFMSLDPYFLRKKALDEKISKYEFGRIVYFFIKKRGFKSIKKEETISKEDGESLKKIKNLEERFLESDARTVGEYFYDEFIIKNKKLKGKEIATREMYKNELEFIFDTQINMYTESGENIPDFLSYDVRNKLCSLEKDGILFVQKRLKLSKHLRNKCSLEPKKYCAPFYSLIFQEFRMLQELCNIKVHTIEEGVLVDERSLTKDEKILLENKLYNKKTTFSTKSIIKVLNLSDNEFLNYNDDTKFYGIFSSVKLEKIISKDKWNEYPRGYYGENGEESTKKGLTKRNIINFLYTCDNSKRKIDYLVNKIGLSNEEAEEAIEVKLEPSNYKKKFSRFSEKAMRKINIHLRDGAYINEAIKMARYSVEKEEKFAFDEHGIISSKLFHDKTKNIRNNSVKRILSSIFKNVQNFYDKFSDAYIDEIKLEMVREAGVSKEVREQIYAFQKNKEKNNVRISKILEKEFNIKRPSNIDIERYKLWEECKGVCVYTGKEIHKSSIFDSTLWERDHIVPWDRSFDNSFNNKVLCCAKFNSEKLKKTPYEFFVGNKEEWKEFTKRISKTIGNRNKLKTKLLKSKKIDKEFTSRMLHDTSYIAKEVRDNLAQFCNKVICSNGKVTSLLRKKWDVGKKNRKNHRHHMEDAILLAFTNGSHINEISRSLRHNRDVNEDKFNKPFEGFNEFFDNIIKNTIVKHKNKNKVASKKRNVVFENGEKKKYKNVSIRSGALHKETYFSALLDRSGNYVYDGNYQFFKKTINLKDLTKNQVDNIIDDNIRKILKEGIFRSVGVVFGGIVTKKDLSAGQVEMSVKNHPETKKINGKKFSEILIQTIDKSLICVKNKKGELQNTTKKVKVFCKFHKDKVSQLYSGINKWVQTSNNNHIVIQKNKKENYEIVVVSQMEAADRYRKKQPIVDVNAEGFVMSIKSGDMFVLGLEDKKINWEREDINKFLSEHTYVVYKISDVISIRKHYWAIDSKSNPYDDSDKNIYQNDLGGSKFMDKNPIKVIINKFGKIIPAY